MPRKWRHSRYCQATDKAKEPRCDCGHPKCLHLEVAKMTVLGRYGLCRSQDCDGQCEGWTEEEKEAQIKIRFRIGGKMVTFRVGSHTITGQAVQMVEVWRDGIFVAAIYPHEAGLHIVSKYLEAGTQTNDFPPSVLIRLKQGG